MKIEGHYRTKTTLLHHRYRLDQFNYELTLTKFATSAALNQRSARKKQHAITLNAVTVKIYRNATNRQTRYLKFN